MYTIPNKFLPKTDNKINTLLFINNDNIIDLKTEYKNLLEFYDIAINNLSNINTQITLVQNTLNSLETIRLEKRKIYLIEQNILLETIKNKIILAQNLRNNNFTSQNILDSYIDTQSYINSLSVKIKDYYEIINNSLLIIIEYATLINNNFNLINSLNLFINDINFGIYADEEITSLKNSTLSRNNPQYLLTLCETNNIIALNNVYIPLPLVNVVGNNIFQNYINIEENNILNIIPLTF
jgi:hypothetical protein